MLALPPDGCKQPSWCALCSKGCLLTAAGVPTAAPLLPLAHCAGLGPRSPAYMTAQTLEAMIDTIGDFFKRQPTGGKCHNCGAHNPTIKR